MTSPFSALSRCDTGRFHDDTTQSSGLSTCAAAPACSARNFSSVSRLHRSTSSSPMSPAATSFLAKTSTTLG